MTCSLAPIPSRLGPKSAWLSNRHQDQTPPLRKFVVASCVIAVAVLLLFLFNIAYLFGSVYRQGERGVAFHVLLVDYDGGVVGRSLISAYQHLQSSSFPTLITQPQTQYPGSDSIIQAVRARHYWAAIFTSPNASENLSVALQGGRAATAYNATDALTYVWNEVRYPTTADSVIESSFALLVDATRMAYNAMNGTNALKTLAQNDTAAVRVYLNPINAKSINVNAMPQGAKIFYNTISMAMPILQQFFFILALNGISDKFNIYEDMRPKDSGTLRAAVSIVYTFTGALCMTGYIWAFREDWGVNGSQFVKTWMILWLLMHIYFCLVDAATAILPQPAIPFFIITWIFLSISATISPFEITPGFYRWGYALPAYSAYEILTYIWSDGPAPELHRALPIMFVWWSVGLTCALLSHRFRCRGALSTAISLSLPQAEEPPEPNAQTLEETLSTGVEDKSVENATLAASRVTTTTRDHLHTVEKNDGVAEAKILDEERVSCAAKSHSSTERLDTPLVRDDKSH